MKKLKDAVGYLTCGFVMTMKKNNSDYIGYILKYDGSIFKDVFIIEIEKFLTQFPNIEKQLDKGFSYHAVYDFETKKYQRSIISSDKKEGYKTLKPEEIIENFQVLNASFLDGMIDLDTKIANKKDTNPEKQKRKVS